MSFQVDTIYSEPLLELPCVTTAPGGRGTMSLALPVLCALSKDLPEDLDAILATADLQYYDRDDVPIADQRLMGEVLAEELLHLCAHGLLPPAQRIGVILAGDFYAVPSLDKRGGLGDVQRQWDAFGKGFRWVAGVAGNHDSFGKRCEVSAFRAHPGEKYLLNAQTVTINGLRIAGLCGILGSSDKPWRRDVHITTHHMRSMLAKHPDILILHEGPNVPDQKLIGQDLIRALIDEQKRKPLTICGHCHWKTPLAWTPNGGQVLNVDGRAVLIMREVPDWICTNAH